MSISDLALGPVGWVSRIGFIIFAILLVFEIIRLRAFVPRGKITRIAVAFFLIPAVGFIFLAAFIADPPVVHTLHGLIHNITARAIATFFTLGCLLITFGFKDNPRWRGFYTYTILVAIIAAICIIIRFIMPLKWAYFGLYERIMLWNGVIWFEAVGIKLFGFSTHGH